MKNSIYNYFISFIFISTSLYSSELPTRAICIVPVTDLLNISAQLISPYTDSKSIYASIPFSPEKESNEMAYLTCLRVHQAIFNEEVEILEELENEIKIKINTAFYYLSRNNFVKNTYWTLKKNFRRLSELEESKIDINKIPPTIDCNNINYNDLSNQKIIVLKLPFLDKITDKIYSVGTRFVYKDKNEIYYTAFIYDANKNKIIESKIPKKNCLEFEKISNVKKIQNFINLLKLWVDYNNNQLPYVWGGSSMQTIPNQEKKLLKLCEIDSCVNTVNNDNEYIPCSGFDCSGLILRGAQISGIPYFFKDCLTINKHLNPLKKEDFVEAGDLIWFCGHIIVISNVSKNLCIESRGYSSGHGKLHEIPVGKIFKGINNFNQLKEIHLKNGELQVINKLGKVTRLVNNFKILKFNSVFKYGKL